MVRVAGLMKQVASGRFQGWPLCWPVAVQLQLIREKVRQIGEQALHLWAHEVHPALELQGIKVVESISLDAEERAAVNAYFQQPRLSAY